MIRPTITPLALIAVIWTGAACGQVQVYETRDKDGNPVFSDQPSEGANTIDVAPTNSADAPPDIPSREIDNTPSATSPDTASNQPELESRVRVINDDDDDSNRRIDDGFEVEHTDSGDIIVNQRELKRLDQNPAIYEGGRRITVKKPAARPGNGTHRGN